MLIFFLLISYFVLHFVHLLYFCFNWLWFACFSQRLSLQIDFFSQFSLLLISHPYHYFLLFEFELNLDVYSLSFNVLALDYNLCFSYFTNIIIFSNLELLYSFIIYCLLWNRKLEIILNKGAQCHLGQSKSLDGLHS